MDSWFWEEMFSEWNDPFDCIFHVVVVVVSHHSLLLFWFTVVTSFIHLALLLHLLANKSLTSHYALFFARAFNSRDEEDFFIFLDFYPRMNGR